MHARISANPSASQLGPLAELAVVMVLLGALLSLMTVDQAVGDGAGPKLFVLGRMALLLLLCTWLLRRSGERWADVGLRRPPRWWTIPAVVAGGFGAFIAIAVLAGPLLAALGIEPPRHTGAALQGNLLEYLFWAGPVAWGSAAFGEELLLRGFVLDRIAKSIGSTRAPALLAAAVLQGALFGSLHFHQGLGGILVTGAIGIVLGLMWLLGGRNLWACIVLHGIVNSITHYESFVGATG